jgi:hypothetical protein
MGRPARGQTLAGLCRSGVGERWRRGRAGLRAKETQAQPAVCQAPAAARCGCRAPATGVGGPAEVSHAPSRPTQRVLDAVAIDRLRCGQSLERE